MKQANPDDDVGDPKRANVVRTGQTGRERLGTDDEMEAIVQAKVVDDRAPVWKLVSFFEVADDDGKQAYFIAIAPHGGEIERHTDEQAEQAVRELTAACFPASSWLCKGDGDKDKGAFDRWHITSEDIQPACFPLLEPLVSRTILLRGRLSWLPAQRGRSRYLYRWSSFAAAEEWPLRGH